jgi:hypothetical protein
MVILVTSPPQCVLHGFEVADRFDRFGVAEHVALSTRWHDGAATPISATAAAWEQRQTAHQLAKYCCRAHERNFNDQIAVQRRAARRRANGHTDDDDKRPAANPGPDPTRGSLEPWAQIRAQLKLLRLEAPYLTPWQALQDARRRCHKAMTSAADALPVMVMGRDDRLLERCKSRIRSCRPRLPPCKPNAHSWKRPMRRLRPARPS